MFYLRIKFFVNKYKSYASSTADVNVKFSIFNVIPKQSIELISIIFICILLFFLSKTTNENSDLIFRVGIYSAFFLRILPIANQIQMLIQNILFSKNSLENLEEEFTK